MKGNVATSRSASSSARPLAHRHLAGRRHHMPIIGDHGGLDFSNYFTDLQDVTQHLADAKKQARIGWATSSH